MDSFENWYYNEASEEDKGLMDRVENFGDLFDDMLFKNGTCSYKLTKVRMFHNGESSEVGDELPEELDLFSYEQFRYKVEKLSDKDGFFSSVDSLLCVAPDAEDSTVLHEMIHLHETVINELPMFYHDMLLWALYQDLRQRIPALDEIVTNHAHLLTGRILYESGGNHDILFLLKSFDLDIRMGYALGTVFAYGRNEMFDENGYTYQKKQS